MFIDGRKYAQIGQPPYAEHVSSAFAAKKSSILGQ